MLFTALLALAPQFPESATASAKAAPTPEPLAGYALPRRELPPAARRIHRGARPGTYFDAVGTRSFLCGTEDGPLECWVWPWQVFHDGRLAFRPEKALDAADLHRRASEVLVEPHATTIRYASEDLFVDALFLCPDDERVALVLLAIDADAPGTLSFSFAPRLQPQWPAAVVGSPWASRATEGQQYLLPGGALRLEIQVDPARCRKEWIPIAIVAADGPGAPARAREAYVKALREAGALLDRHAKSWEAIAGAIPTIQADSSVDDAFFWNAVSLRQGLVRSEALGDGLVAGYAAAGPSSQRPGFAWYFTGDVSVNAPAYLAAGLADALAVGLRFAIRHQRDDGKIPHEVVLSAHLCDWFARYPFAFIHGETTGLWIHACRQYLDHTGDRAFFEEAWPAIVKGARWILAQDADGDGLPDNARAGMGASEIGALRAGLRTDIYLASASAVALRDAADLAALRGDEVVGREMGAAAARAAERIANGFWDESQGSLAHALLEDGTLSKERTAWPAVAVAWKLVGGERARRTMALVDASDLTTPWGVRFLSAKSPLFDPKGYNQGAVWPFVTGLAAAADFEAGHADEGFAKVKAVADLTFAEALGRTPEVLSGTRRRTLDASVPHQLFSSTAVVDPAIHGWLGFTPDALRGAIAFRPCFPDSWGDRRVTVRGIAYAKDRLDVLCERRAGKYFVEVTGSGPEPRLSLAPRNGADGSVSFRRR